MLVINTRESNDGKKRRRRYRCQKCKMTYVTLEEFSMVVTVMKAVAHTSNKDAADASTPPS